MTTIRKPLMMRTTRFPLVVLLLLLTMGCVWMWTSVELTNQHDPWIPPPSPQAAQPTLTTTSHPDRPCHQNPYLPSLREPAKVLGARADLWLYDLPQHLEASSSMNQYSHRRFSVFDDSMATCESTACVGGACLEDQAKIVCGLEQLQPKTSAAPCIVYSIGGNNQVGCYLS